MKTIKINEDTHALLMLLKISKGYKTIDQTIKEIIYKKSREPIMAVLENDK